MDVVWVRPLIPKSWERKRETRRREADRDGESGTAQSAQDEWAAMPSVSVYFQVTWLRVGEGLLFSLSLCLSISLYICFKCLPYLLKKGVLILCVSNVA